MKRGRSRWIDLRSRYRVVIVTRGALDVEVPISTHRTERRARLALAAALRRMKADERAEVIDRLTGRTTTGGRALWH